MKEKIYLDNAATTGLSTEVFAAMLPYFSIQYGNPSSLHGFGREARIAIEKSRKTVAGLLGVKPSTITFTGSGTEANNMAIAATAKSGTIDHIISSATEHHAVLHPIEKTGLPFSFIQPDEYGKPSMDDLEQHVRKIKGRCMVSLMAANNETGVLTDIAHVAGVCSKYEAIFHTDAVQYIGHYPIDLGTIKIDFASASGHKFHGPKGTGILYTREGAVLTPLLEGGGQERGLRSGTENVAGIVGFAKALEISLRDFEKNKQYILDLRTRLKNALQEIWPAIVINEEPQKEGLYSVLSVSFPFNENSDDLVLQLDQSGIAVSGGSACTAGGVSHVMRAIGRDQGYETIRFSFSSFNKASDIIAVINTLKNIFNKIVA